MLAQASPWTVSKELLKNFLTHLFYSIDPHISQPSVFREWESVWQSKWIKAHTVSFLHNSLCLPNPLPRCSEGMGTVWGSWVHFLPGQEGSPGFPAQAFSVLISKLSQPLTRCVPFPSTLGPWMQQLIIPFCHSVPWCDREQCSGAKASELLRAWGLFY